MCDNVYCFNLYWCVKIEFASTQWESLIKLCDMHWQLLCSYIMYEMIITHLLYGKFDMEIYGNMKLYDKNFNEYKKMYRHFTFTLI